jgi:large conductance mechanosensitive channel
MLKEFRDLAARGNVVDLAVGVIIGAAFGKIVTSLVNDVVMPPIGLAIGKVDFRNLYWTLNDQVYPSLAEAQKAGAPTINYGLFINACISFLIVTFILFMLLRQLNRLVAPTPSTEAAPPPSEEVLLLREIRDSLKAR